MKKNNVEFKQQLHELENDISEKKYLCLHANCPNIAIRSHSQQKNKILSTISKNNKVYSLDANLFRAFDIKKDEFIIKFKETQISQASTFTGFCTEHEDLFSPFERFEIEFENEFHAALLSFRTIGYEIARKRDAIERFKFNARFNLHDNIKMAQLLEETIDNELKPLLDENLSKIINRAYNNITSIWRKIPRNIGVACSSCMSMYQGSMQDFYKSHPNEILPTFTFNVLPYADHTIIVISWQNEFAQYSQWINDAFCQNEFSVDLFNKLLFLYSEDVCINPDLWKSNPDFEKITSQINHVFDYKKIIEHPTLKLVGI